MSKRKKLPLVSVIIPTHNRAGMLRLTVESVLAQTYPNIETIVVDDGSTDDTAIVMNEYAGRVTYIRQANQGVAPARNRGIRAATGTYLNFVDDDDIFMPSKIERQVQVMNSRPEVGLVHCGYYHMDGAGNLYEKVWALPEGDVLKELVCGCFLWSGAPLIRRQCLDQIGLFDEKTWSTNEDWDLWLRIAQAGYPFACVQEPLGAYRILPNSRMANTARLEHGVMITLDRVFANPQLLDSVRAIKDLAYGTVRCWLSCRCYAAEHWDEAQRNLTEALTVYPQLLNPPEQLLHAFLHHTLSPHVGDPVKFITDVFDHLPASAAAILPYRSQLLGQIYIGLALRRYALKDIAGGTHLLADAMALAPALLERVEDFADLLTHHATRLASSDPLAYVDTVLKNLPPGAQPLKRVRSRVLSDVNITCAFQNYFAGRRLRVVQQILTALRSRPSSLKNRGVVSIFLRSLLGLMAKERLPARP